MQTPQCLFLTSWAAEHTGGLISAPQVIKDVASRVTSPVSLTPASVRSFMLQELIINSDETRSTADKRIAESVVLSSSHTLLLIHVQAEKSSAVNATSSRRSEKSSVLRRWKPPDPF